LPLRVIFGNDDAHPPRCGLPSKAEGRGGEVYRMTLRERREARGLNAAARALYSAVPIRSGSLLTTLHANAPLAASRTGWTILSGAFLGPGVCWSVGRTGCKGAKGGKGPAVGSGPRRASGSLLKSLLWSFGNSVRQHEAHSIRGSRTINNDVTAFQPGAFASTQNAANRPRRPPTTQQMRVLTAGDSSQAK
jgi:hypothetical protein